MLEYLDNESNRRGRPNENYARELLELFTMGIGNYTEQDIKEAARAFTGWTYRNYEFYFDTRQHDDGSKTFLGRTGNLDGGDIINIIFEQPATARWVPRKLFEYFGYLRPEDSLVDEMADLFRRRNFEVAPLLRAILSSSARKPNGSREGDAFGAGILDAASALGESGTSSDEKIGAGR